MPDQYRAPYSPRGNRSPVVSRQDSSGTLKTTISLGKNPSIVHSGPFYLMKEPPAKSELTGATNLMAHYGLEHSYSKFSGKKVKEQLSSFLPNLPGVIDGPGQSDNSTLRSVIEKPPIGGKELMQLNSMQLSGFRLHPGPVSNLSWVDSPDSDSSFFLLLVTRAVPLLELSPRQKAQEQTQEEQA